MRKVAFSLILALGALANLPAHASDVCKSYPKEQWLSEAQIQAKAEALGYKVRSVGEDDGCLEVKGMNQAGAKVEVYFDPVTAEVVKTKGG